MSSYFLQNLRDNISLEKEGETCCIRSWHNSNCNAHIWILYATFYCPLNSIKFVLKVILRPQEHKVVHSHRSVVLVSGAWKGWQCRVATTLLQRTQWAVLPCTCWIRATANVELYVVEVTWDNWNQPGEGGGQW